ncbi:helix-turn-helix transcriptional regulator [Lentibacillus daqui]|uniref:helix-turn-helix transcriptional regulator n=1 Tax=Lentibacillus daqui TaxID=2911514 RepID=UPI0022B108CD|nr:helix-turn-helix transcriptional regulator [Lentibacillus daqui]
MTQSDTVTFRNVRTLNGLTQAEMAHRIGVSRQLIGLIENEHRNLTPRIEQRFIREFGADQIEYVQGVGDTIRNGDYGT